MSRSARFEFVIVRGVANKSRRSLSDSTGILNRISRFRSRETFRCHGLAYPVIFHLPLLSRDETKVSSVAQKARKMSFNGTGTSPNRAVARGRMHRLKCSLLPQIIPTIRGRKEEPAVYYISATSYLFQFAQLRQERIAAINPPASIFLSRGASLPRWWVGILGAYYCDSQTFGKKLRNLLSFSTFKKIWKLYYMFSFCAYALLIICRKVY